MTALRDVVIQYRDFPTNERRQLLLEEGERVICVESAKKFDPFVRVWIEVPTELADSREVG